MVTALHRASAVMILATIVGVLSCVATVLFSGWAKDDRRARTARRAGAAFLVLLLGATATWLLSA